MFAAHKLQYTPSVHLIFECQVCHHEDCQEANHGHPLLLCLRCDEVHHLGSGSNHARFDVPGKVLDGYKNNASELNNACKQDQAKLTTYFMKYVHVLLIKIIFKTDKLFCDVSTQRDWLNS